MKVILTQNVNKLGKTDDVVNVSDGYARNFLFTKNLAIIASEGALKALAEKQKQAEAKGEELSKKAKNVAKKLGVAVIKINAKAGEEGKLFGTINEKHIAEEVERLYEYKITSEDIELAEPIKQIGKYTAVLRLAKNVRATVKIIIAKAE